MAYVESITIFKGLLVLLGSTTCFGVYLGWTDKAVFYYNAKDLSVSFAALISFPLGIAIASFFQESATVMQLINAAAVIVSSYFFGLAAHNAHLYNNGVLWKAIPVSMAKGVLAFMFLFNLWAAFQKSNKRDYKGALYYAIWSAIFGGMIYHLVNGERVVGARQNAMFS